MTNYLSPFLFNFNEIIELDTEVMILVFLHWTVG